MSINVSNGDYLKNKLIFHMVLISIWENRGSVSPYTAISNKQIKKKRKEKIEGVMSGFKI